MNPLPRKTRRVWDEPGHAHFVTYSCHHRWPLLVRDRSRRWVIDALDQVRRGQDVALWAYVIMPEHVHVVLCPRLAEYEMKSILAGLKRPVSASARAFLEQTKNVSWLERLTVRYRTRTVFRYWQPGGGFDRNVFQERTVPAIIEYVHANPVRRGLVAHPDEWERSSARFWAGRRDVPLLMDEVPV